MLHEVLLALLGHPGSIVQEILVTRRPDHRDDSNDNIFGSAKHSSSKMTCCRSFGVPESVTFLTATERAAINRIVDMGRIYRDLRQFVRLPPLLWAREDAAAVGNHAAGLMGEEDGLYMRALKNGVVEVLDEYARRVAEVEMDVMADPTLTIARIHAGVREFQPILPAILEACSAVAGDGERGPLQGPQLLEALHERSHFGAPDVRRQLCRLVWHCSQVLMNQCVSWLLHGVLLDPYQEFFVQKNIDPIARAVTRPNLAANLDDASHDRASGLDRGVEVPVSGGVGDWSTEEEWNSTYTVRLQLVPSSFVPHRLAQKMLFVGKVVRVLRHVNSSTLHPKVAAHAEWSRDAYPKPNASPIGLSPGENDIDGSTAGFADGDVSVSEEEVLHLTKRWSDLRDRDSFHLLALERAVHESHSLVDRRLYRLMVNVAGLERHLSNIKGLFLMGDGALFHSFFEKATEPMRSLASDRAVLELNTWLAAAAEDGDTQDTSYTQSASQSASPPYLPSSHAIDRARLDLDPPGFACKAFQDLPRQGFCVTGKAKLSPQKACVCLCPGGFENSSALKHHPLSSAKPSRSGAGSLWYTSGRALPRGFRTLVAFRSDRMKPNRAKASSPEKSWRASKGNEGEETAGSISFVVHNHRRALGGCEEGAGGTAESATVPNSLTVRVQPDGKGGGQVSVRWNPHRGPILTPPEMIGQASPSRDGSVQRGEPPPSQENVRVLGQALLPPSCDLSLGQVNYLMLDYTPPEARRGGGSGGKGHDEGDKLGGNGGSGARAKLRVFVNDPGRSGLPLLSVDVDLWKLIEMGGGRAFVGVSAEGRWRTVLRQWDFHLGSAITTNGQSAGPLGGVGSGPRVEKMLEAMDSWSGLCLDYRLEWPLHLVLTRETMQTYNRLFRLLASVKRASLELDRLWPTLMQSRYRGLPQKEKAWLGPLWMLRARMAFFVSNLAFYLQVDVVEAAYSVLQSKLGAVEDFVSFQRGHQEFLSTLRAKFYLDNLEISQGLGRALRHVLRFCCLFILHGDAKDILRAEVTALQDAFQQEMQLLMPVLERLAKELTMRLDFNGYFSTHIMY